MKRLNISVLLLAAVLILAGCGVQEPVATQPPAIAVTEAPAPVTTQPPTEAPTEVPTEIDIDSIVYEPGSDVKSAGHKLEEDAFALTDRTFDISLAVEKTADEIKAMLADKTSMTEGAVYIVKEPIILDSNTKEKRITK